MKLKILVLSVGILSLSSVAAAADDTERKAVEKAVYDYVDALYLVEPARIDASVHPELAKRGYMPKKDAEGFAEYKMTHAQLRDLAAKWNKNGRVDPKTAPREVTVLDMLPQIASAKLVAHWGVDYFHLAKYDGRWQIVNVIWQTPPKTDAATNR